LCAKKFNSVALIGAFAETHPNEVKMVGHKAIHRAEQAFGVCSVQHHLAKSGVERLVQPAFGTVRDGHGPEDDGVGLVKFAPKTG